MVVNNNTSIQLSKNLRKVNKPQDKMLENLQKQSNAINKKLSELDKNDKLNSNQKAEQKKELEKQLSEINKAMEQRQEQLKPANDELKKQNNKVDKYEPTTKEEQEAKKLVKLSSTLKSVKNQNATKKSLEGNIRILSKEIELDKSRGVDTKKKEELLAKTKERLESTTKSIANSLKSVSKESKAEKEENPYKKLVEEMKAQYDFIKSGAMSLYAPSMDDIQLYSFSQGKFKTSTLSDMISKVMEKRLNTMI